MIYLLIDTCTWLNIAKDHEQQSLLTVIENLVSDGEVTLIVPRVIIHEIEKNKQKVINETGQSIRASLRRAHEVISKHGKKKFADSLNRFLDNVEFRSPIVVAAAKSAISRIEKLLNDGLIIETTPDLKLAAIQRAIDNKAPFHKNRNSVNDAIIIESYISLVQAPSSKGNRFMFVTHNKHDFSDMGRNDNHPHPDLGPVFSRLKSQYYIKLIEALRRINPRATAGLNDSEIVFEVRRIDEIKKYENEFYERRWYARHTMFSKIKGWDLDDLTLPGNRSAKQLEKKYGLPALGPMSDFDWGMLSGKHSALRWVLGDEWDMLDT